MGNLVSVIIPTYNEKENISKIISEIQNVASTCKPWDIHILVVDDNSPDGTANDVEQLKKQYSNVHLLKRQAKEGLGAAYIAGFKHAMATLHPDVIFQMDADLSHNPGDIPRFLQQIENGADFVIGCRYIPDGKIVGWPVHRKLISFGGNTFARFVAGMRKVHDCTSGYRAIRTEVLQNIPLDQINTWGYAFLLELLWQANHANARIVELPIIFTERRHGETKMGLKDMVQYFLTCFRLRFQK